IELSVEIEGPGLGRQPIGSLVTKTETVATKPAAPGEKKDDDTLVVDAALAEKGRTLFTSAGCASCHALKNVPPPSPATPLAKARPDAGCLSEQPARGTPWFGLSAAQRTALAAAIKSPANSA